MPIANYDSFENENLRPLHFILIILSLFIIKTRQQTIYDWMNDTNLVNVLQLNISRIIIDGTSGLCKAYSKEKQPKSWCLEQQVQHLRKNCKIWNNFLIWKVGLTRHWQTWLPSQWMLWVLASVFPSPLVRSRREDPNPELLLHHSFQASPANKKEFPILTTWPARTKI